MPSHSQRPLGRPAPLAIPTSPHRLWAPVLLLVLLVALRMGMGLSWPVPLSVDEAQYWVWARELQAGYYSKPPFIAMVLSVPQAVCGPEVVEGCIRFLQPLGFAGAALFVGLTAQHLMGSLRAAMWSAALVLTLPLAVFYSQIASTDAWLAFWWGLSLFAFAKAVLPRAHPGLLGEIPDGSLGWWLLLGAAVGMGILTKYSMAAFGLSAAVLLLLRGQLWRSGPVLAAVVAMVVVLPNVLWNATWGFPTFAHHAEITLAQQAGASALRLLEFLGLQFIVFGPGVVLASMAALAFGQRGLGLGGLGGLHQARGAGRRGRWGATAIGLGLWFALPLLAIAALQALLGEANANWAAPAALGLCLAAVGWALRPGREERPSGLARTMFGGSVALGLSATAFFLALPWLIAPLGLDAQRSTNPMVSLVGYKDAAMALRTYVPTRQIASGHRGLLASIDAHWPEATPKAWWPEAQGHPPHHWALQQRLDLSAAVPEGSTPERWLVVEPVALTEDPQALTDRLVSSAQRAGIAIQTQPLSATHPVLAERLAGIRLADRAGTGIRGVWVWAVKMEGPAISPAPPPLLGPSPSP